MQTQSLIFQFVQSFHAWLTVGILVFGLSLPLSNISAQDKNNQDKSPESSTEEPAKKTEPKDELEDIQSKFRKELQDLSIQYREAEDQADRDDVIQQRRELEKLSVMNAISVTLKRDNENQNIRDLAWFLSQQIKGEARQRLIAEIKNSYLNSKDTWRFAEALSEVKSPHPDVEATLRFLKEKSSVAKVRATASLGLVGYLENIKKRRVPGRTARAIDTEIESLLNECVDQFSEIKSGRSTIGKLATKKLTLINLKIGKIAPEIQGVDLDDQEFKLSEYRGKVVVIDFWGDW
ncbi:MAG: hypothetical protein P8J27_10540 [Mariniblastus sp.]|nr:hypothetical protein [Mariniblastus sp.]